MHHRSTIEPGGQACASLRQYYVINLVKALNNFGRDVWDQVVCILTMGVKRDLITATG